MLLHRIVSPGLAHYSYLVGDGNEAVVIDPRRDFDVYLDLARDAGVRIRTVLETHRNEDLVSGANALSQAVGATVLHSHHLHFEYGNTVSDGDEIGAGRLRLRAIETPGHTPESLTFALIDTASGDDPVIAFTGDALFVGDTGRTDLGGPERARAFAEQLYDSVFRKILPLGAGVILCPAPGGGSVCGGNISDRELSTLGYERHHHPQLARPEREPFVAAKLAEEHVAPPYFSRREEYNRRGNAPAHARVPVPPPMAAGELAERIRDSVSIVDARTPQAFAGGHIPRSYNVWRGGLSSYLSWAVPIDAPIALVLPEEADVEEVGRALYRIGFDRVVGYLRGGFETWQNEGRPVARLDTIDTEQLRARRARNEELELVDVRTPSEWRGGTLPGARTIFVGDLERRAREIPRGRPVVTMCSVGSRGGLAASILARHGFREVMNYLGGHQAWTARHADD